MDKSIDKFSFIFYDYETFGVHPALDKPAQFACVRTDINFNIIEPTYCFYCAPPRDYLPAPEAVLLTGITPQYTQKYGCNEFFFSKKIFRILNISNSCILGYNNIQFDDEITRNIFYRNLLDPYSWSWKNFSSKWDVMCLMRACYILTPHGILWPKNKFGFISFRLEDFTTMNNIHHRAHDALSDVYATIDVIRFIKKKKPELFNFCFKYRLKKNIKKIINIQNYEPLMYISHIFGSVRNNTTCIMPIFWVTESTLLFFDLYMDISILIKYLHTIQINKMSIKTLNSLGIGIMNINKCPILIPVNFFSKTRLLNLGININLYFKKKYILQTSYSTLKVIKTFFQHYTYSNLTDNVDLKIYDAFFSEPEKNVMRKIHSIKVDYWKSIKFELHSNKLKEMFFRLRGRNFPDSLNTLEKIMWKKYCLQVFSKRKIDNYYEKLENMFNKYNEYDREYQLLLKLKQYVTVLIKGL